MQSIIGSIRLIAPPFKYLMPEGERGIIISILQLNLKCMEVK